DPGAIAKSATSVWQAVVDRDRYLARRQQQGVVEGRLAAEAAVAAPAAPSVPSVDGGAPPAPRRSWLVDDSEGDGSLAIHVDLSGVAGAPPKPGARVAITGAWALDNPSSLALAGSPARRWYWKAASVVALPVTPPPDPA